MILQSTATRFRIAVPKMPNLYLEALVADDGCAWFWCWDGRVICPVDPAVA